MPKGRLGRKKTQRSKSKASSVEKGNALEQAVRAIETAILTTSPVYQGNTFIISSKKKLRVKGVQHEIDIWVEIDLCKGYKSRFIFECRNRKKKANKNDIMLFSAIIAAVQAQTGFFIAKSFTKDARAQAQQDPRITLLLASEYPTLDSPLPYHFHHLFIFKDKANARLFLYERGGNSENIPLPIDLDHVSCRLRDSDINFNQRGQELISNAMDERAATFPSATTEEGSYSLMAKACLDFSEGELQVNKREIGTLLIEVEFPVRVVGARVVSHFEVETRGRVISFAPVDIAGTVTQAGFVFILKDST